MAGNAMTPRITSSPTIIFNMQDKELISIVSVSWSMKKNAKYIFMFPEIIHYDKA